jgi:hypothetical protein
VSLIREQTAAIKPPRALWVPFMLGRPFGVPNDPGFQRRVLLHLLALFTATQGPVLEDFPDDAPADPADLAGFACPVSFGPLATSTFDVGAAFLAEVAQLATWHEQAQRRRGRTTVGISGIPVEAAARLIAAVIREEPVSNPKPDVGLGTLIKRCCDDIKAYYFEAAAARPGQLSARAIDRWFWHETAAAHAFLRLHDVGRRHADPSVAAAVERSLVPRKILHASERD